MILKTLYKRRKYFQKVSRRDTKAAIHKLVVIPFSFKLLIRRLD